ncbi:MAG: 50S ribosomal protein L2 [Candidatus Paceibacterota bacterium]|jgi:large subunit ribosomal protein L2|nr:50S ribosomal protein L2 [Candidatus Paceibacterota bacterium]MDD4830788.1 50S ribosomal protein L2 [Candidatus Paceibacterota bacterium]MDD4875290.1 50S ribosomal protein L2 [Candidatus Paceibacterota bacterium]
MAVQVQKTKLTKNKKPEKVLLLRRKKTGGRSSSGRITVRHIGGGCRKLCRIIDFGQKNLNMSGKVAAIEYDPNRTGYLALVEYENKEKKYIIAPEGIKEGDEIIASENAPISLGNRLQLKNIPEGTLIHNIEIMPGQGGKMVRSAGSNAVIMAHEEGFCNLKMSSSEIRKISGECFASIGAVSNSSHRFQKKGRAGVSRKKGIRPSVRGTTMNPCDHPHGGGEGRAGIGMKHPKTPWGKPALGVKTRKRTATNKYILARRKNKKRK